MNILQTILILVAAFLAVFGEATFPVLRHWLGAQVDLLPVLMVYAALNRGHHHRGVARRAGRNGVRCAVGQSAGDQHPAALCRRIP